MDECGRRWVRVARPNLGSLAERMFSRDGTSFLVHYEESLTVLVSKEDCVSVVPVTSK